MTGLLEGGLRSQQKIQESGREASGDFSSSCLLLSVEILNGTRIELKKGIIFVLKNTLVECFDRVWVLLLSKGGRDS